MRKESKTTVKVSSKTPDDAPNLTTFKSMFSKWPNTKTTPRRKRQIWPEIDNARIS